MFFLFALSIVLFLLSIDYISKNIDEKVSQKVKDLILSINHNSFLLLLIGAGATMIVQSSSLIISLIIVLVGNKKIDFKDSLYLMMGSNIGTCSTAFLSSINSTYFLFFLLGLYFLFRFFFKRNIKILLGVSMLFMSITLLDAATLPLSKSHIFLHLFSNENSTFFNLFVSSFFTSITQSSSAVIASLQSFLKHNFINIKTATDMMMGANIGTCSTAFLASLKGGELSRKSAKFNLNFNLVGVLFFLLFRRGIPIYFLFQSFPVKIQISLLHLLFNILNVLVYLPFLHKKK